MSFTPIETIADLEALYGTPGEASLVKVADRLTDEYRKLIQASPFFALASVGPEGLDCSPRGDGPFSFAIQAICRNLKTFCSPAVVRNEEIQHTKYWYRAGR